MFQNFTVIDFETTGLDPEGDEILEVGAVRFRDGKPSEEFSRFADPGRSIPKVISKLTGISNEDVAGQPSPKEVLKEMQKFLGDEEIVVAHNIEFEAAFLKAKGMSGLGKRLYDTLALSRIVWPERVRHDLRALCEFIGVDASFHRATDDSRVTGLLWLALMDGIDSMHPAVVHTLAEFLGPVNTPLAEVFLKFDERMLKESMLRQSGKYPDFFEDFTEYLDELRNKKEELHPPELLMLEPERMGRMFSPNGVFAKRKEGFEYRQQQVDMVQAICEVFNEGRHALIEAGTGTGKSLAYSACAIGWSILNGLRVVISTNTKSLQDQLCDKDLPELQKVLQKPYKTVRVKGSDNYLCVNHLLNVLSKGQGDLQVKDRLPIAALAVWATRTTSGDVTECPGFINQKGREIWSRLNLGGGECMRTCRNQSRCFLYKARGEAMRANIVIANHALVFTDMAMENGILPNYAYLILDEAHNVERVATDHLSREVTSFRVFSLLDNLYVKEKKQGRGALGYLHYAVQRDLTKKDADPLKSKFEYACEQVEVARSASGEFFDALSLLFEGGKGGAREPDKKRYKSETQEGAYWQTILRAGNELCSALNAILDAANDVSEQVTEQKKLSILRVPIEELKRLTEDLSELSQDVEFILEARSDNDVFWIEKERWSGRWQYSAHAAPIDIGPLLRQHLFEKKATVIMVSATLSTGGSFEFFKQRIGMDHLAEQNFCELQLGSCFDLQSQALLAIPAFLPEPGYQARDFGEKLGHLLVDALRATKGRALVLCTSYSLLEELYEPLKRDLELSNIRVLAQGIDGEASSLTEDFKADNSSVLLGTQSFWEGFDAPGNTLCCVVVCKLPFPVFKDPIVEARCELLESRNINSFAHFMVPSAAIRLKQGFGRLIRTKNDYGVVLLTDNRMLTKRYGSTLLQSLPIPHIAFNDVGTLVQQFQRFFEVKDAQGR
ncbi:MAG: exonuclease domain-containing protein [Planctomycetota bacterium]|nr:exonuclease domain-containing protein [Planctomycetota bacterium]MDA1138921.1 exonuclease domain-containing protein [Planctomycetota bacterium]